MAKKNSKAAKTKKIGGNVFNHLATKLSKRDANAIVKEQKNKGMYVRVFQRKSDKAYMIYIRKSPVAEAMEKLEKQVGKDINKRVVKICAIAGGVTTQARGDHDDIKWRTVSSSDIELAAQYLKAHCDAKEWAKIARNPILMKKRTKDQKALLSLYNEAKKRLGKDHKKIKEFERLVEGHADKRLRDLIKSRTAKANASKKTTAKKTRKKAASIRTRKKKK